MTHYLIGRVGEGGPGIASTRDLEGLLATVPQLEPGEYWIAIDRVCWGLAWVFSPSEWEIDAKGLRAGPGYIIV